jgi:hypothetical protein
MEDKISSFIKNKPSLFFIKLLCYAGYLNNFLFCKPVAGNNYFYCPIFGPVGVE